VVSDFPNSEDHAPVGTGDEWAVSKEGLPLPRLWLIEEGGANLIQLQVNRFYLNWRRAAGSSYPGFKAHFGKFSTYLRHFGKFLRLECGTSPPVVGGELLKVSQLIEGSDWSYESLPKLFPVLNLDEFKGLWGCRGLSLVLALNYAESPLGIEMKTARHVTDKSKSLLQIEIRVPISGIEGSAEEQGNLEERISKANEIANLAFTSIASPEAQRNVWHRRS
jgi:hypothetical protein